MKYHLQFLLINIAVCLHGMEQPQKPEIALFNIAMAIIKKSFQIRIINRRYHFLWQQENGKRAIQFSVLSKELKEIHDAFTSKKNCSRMSQLKDDSKAEFLPWLITKEDAATRLTQNLLSALKRQDGCYDTTAQKAYNEFEITCKNRDVYLRPFLEGRPYDVDKSIELYFDETYQIPDEVKKQNYVNFS
jgi:hypothetical protein